jgi:hypothetical protein
LGTPTFTGKAVEVSAPLLTVTLAGPETLVNPETVSDPGAVNDVLRAAPFSDATEVAMNPLPLTVAVKTPSGICAFVPTAVIAGVGASRVTDAFADPPTPVTVTVSVATAGNAAGAVYKPELLTLPYSAVQAVPPLVVNCCVFPRTTLALTGEIVVGALLTTVTVAVAVPPGPFAVTVAVPEAGSADGAV